MNLKLATRTDRVVDHPCESRKGSGRGGQTDGVERSPSRGEWFRWRRGM